MSLDAYRWGWFSSAMSRAIWGWASAETPQGGFTPVAGLRPSFFKAAPVPGQGGCVRDGRIVRTARREARPGTAGMADARAYSAEVSRNGAKALRDYADKGKAAGAVTMKAKLGRRAKMSGTAKAVNKTKKP